MVFKSKELQFESSTSTSSESQLPEYIQQQSTSEDDEETIDHSYHQQILTHDPFQQPQSVHQANFRACMTSVMSTLSEENQEKFIDDVLELYLQYKRQN